MKIKEEAVTEIPPEVLAATEAAAIVAIITMKTSTIPKDAADMATITDIEGGKILWIGKVMNMETGVERIMEMTGIPVAIKTGMIMKETKDGVATQAWDGTPKEIRAERVTAVIGTPEAVAAERLAEAPGVTPVTRNIILRMNGTGKGTKSGTGQTTRWKKMMTIVRKEAQGEGRSSGPQVKTMKACANYLRINSRIFIGLKKH